MSEYEELNPRFKESLLNWMKTKNPFFGLCSVWRLLRSERARNLCDF